MDGVCIGKMFEEYPSVLASEARGHGLYPDAIELLRAA